MSGESEVVGYDYLSDLILSDGGACRDGIAIGESDSFIYSPAGEVVMFVRRLSGASWMIATIYSFIRFASNATTFFGCVVYSVLDYVWFVMCSKDNTIVFDHNLSNLVFGNS